MKPSINASIVKSVIENEAVQSDQFYEASERNTKEIIYLNNELDRLIKTEELFERRHRNFNLKQNIAARKSYAHKTFILTCVWGVLIFIVIFSIAFKKFIFYRDWGFELSDKVLITLITSTTINFFGFFTLVMRYLFNTNEKQMEAKNKRLTQK